MTFCGRLPGSLLDRRLPTEDQNHKKIKLEDLQGSLLLEDFLEDFPVSLLGGEDFQFSLLHEPDLKKIKILLKFGEIHV